MTHFDAHYLARESTRRRVAQSLAAASDKGVQGGFPTCKWRAPWGNINRLPARERRHRAAVTDDAKPEVSPLDSRRHAMGLARRRRSARAPIQAPRSGTAHRGNRGFVAVSEFGDSVQVPVPCNHGGGESGDPASEAFQRRCGSAMRPGICGKCISTRISSRNRHTEREYHPGD